MIIAFDFETHKIRPGQQIPRAVCMSYAVIIPYGDSYCISECGVVPADVGVEYLRQWLIAGCFMVGAATAFDVLVSVRKAPDPAAMLALWVNAYVNDRVCDVLLNQKLIDLACSFRRPTYNLASVLERHHPTLRLAKDSDEIKEIRVSYGKLDGVPIEQYPKAYYDYSLEDSIATAVAWIGQQAKRAKGSAYFPGADILHNQFEQARTSLAIRDLESTGMLADGKAVKLFTAWLDEQVDALRGSLVPSGLVRREVSRNQARAAERVQDLGVPHKLTPKGKVSLAAKTLKTSGDYLLEEYAKFPDCDVQALIDAGLVTIKYSKNEAEIKKRMIGTWPADAQAVAARAWRETRLEASDDDVKLLASLGCRLTKSNDVQIDADACTFALDPTTGKPDELLQRIARYNTLTKTITTDLKLGQSHTQVPLHAHYDLLKETGRTGSSPNVQNMPRKPGVREMWAAPPGWDICEADFSAVELHAFAEICYRVLGWSRTGEMLNEGIDLHLVMAAAYFHIEYEEAKRRKASGDGEIGRARTMGKGVNFGAKGAMGPDRFVEYCWNNYGLIITREQAVELLELHKKICAEFPSYTQWIKSMQREPGRYQSPIDLVQPWSGRLRNSCGYCDAHNSPFQGLAADLAGVALWRMFLACYGMGELGKEDPLYGCKLWLFVHDSIAVLSPEGRSHEVAMRVSEVMQGAGRDVLPHCPPKAEPLVCRQLSKLAEPRFKGGRLVPWDAWEVIREVYKARGLDALRDDDWPEYMIRDMLGNQYTPPPTKEVT